MDELHFISIFYGDKRAERSGAPLINHINEGLAVLKHIGASEMAMRAYCLHPIVQSDADFRANYHLMCNFDGAVVALAMEYRRVANAYLSKRTISSIDEIELSPVKEVNDMLIADKVQNRKDFLRFHKGTHQRSQELDEYFKNWFKRLNIDESLMVVAGSQQAETVRG